MPNRNMAVDSCGMLNMFASLVGRWNSSVNVPFSRSQLDGLLHFSDSPPIVAFVGGLQDGSMKNVEAIIGIEASAQQVAVPSQISQM